MQPVSGGLWNPEDFGCLSAGQLPWNWSGNNAETSDFMPHQTVGTPAGACLIPLQCALPLIQAYNADLSPPVL